MVFYHRNGKVTSVSRLVHGSPGSWKWYLLSRMRLACPWHSTWLICGRKWNGKEVKKSRGALPWELAIQGKWHLIEERWQTLGRSNMKIPFRRIAMFLGISKVTWKLTTTRQERDFTGMFTERSVMAFKVGSIQEFTQQTIGQPYNGTLLNSKNER